MALAPGTRLGSYEIVGPLGAGGMGEVYRARDTRLNRDVALKVLPELFLHDPERLARFEREAQVLASLNHPNIAHIYGVEQNALVMELVEGQDLSALIAHGIRGSEGPGLQLEKTLAIARQIVDAVEAAHERGVIHRDLKPANIKVREDGTVKVLDFGLAKALAPPGSEDSGFQNSSHSPTISARATEMGLILGTAAYMSPEQAKGKTADQRADVWAFGVVLFEMIAGKQTFTGETPSEVMASVLKEDPNWALLPPNLPSALRRLLRRCLEKDPKKRLSSMSDIRIELSEKDIAVADVPGAPARGSKLGLIGAALAGAVVTAAAGFFLLASVWRSGPEPAPSRVTVLGPEGVTLVFDAAESAISPDGRTLAFSAADQSGITKLWTRPLDLMEARQLAGTENGRQPFWSPDSRQIGFFTNDKLKKMPAGGGTIEVLCLAPDGRGASWGSQNVIVFAPSNAGPLQSVSANGGEPKAATSLDAARGETGHRFPSFLPDGRHFIFAALPKKKRQFALFVGSVDDQTRVEIGAAESAAVYAEPGYVIFPRDGVLFAQAFDVGKLQLTGEPSALTDAPGATGGLYSAGRPVSVSSNGTLAYLGDRLPNTKLVWLDRNGRETGSLPVPEGRYQEIKISPDGRRAGIVRFATQDDSEIWIVGDVVRGGATRFTTERALNTGIAWSPDSARIMFSADVSGPRDLFVKPSSGAAAEKLLYGSAALFKDSRGWSPDDKFVLFELVDPRTNRDLWMLPVDGSKATPYVQSPYNDTFPTFSPDGQWVAYTSDESGRNEVYIDSFPVPRSKYKLSENGGAGPFWRKDGKEIMFTTADGHALYVADVTTGSAISASQPRKLFDLPTSVVVAAPTGDHERVLASLAVSENNFSRLTLVFDWVSGLKKK